MKKQPHKLYYHMTIGQKPVELEDGVFVWNTNSDDFPNIRVDICTCDNIFTAIRLRDILRYSLKRDIQIEEVEVDNYDE